MKIPDSIDSVPLTRETVLDLAVRTGLDPQQLYTLLDKNEAEGVTSIYVFSLYKPETKKVTGSTKNALRKGAQMFDTTKLAKEVRERPVEVAGVVIGAVIAIAKVADTVASIRSKNAYARQQKDREKNRKRQQH